MPETFFLRIEPIGSSVPPFNAKATAVAEPPSIWGPTDPRPSNPISGVPGLPGYQPPLGIWGPDSPIISQPIVIPPINEPPSPPEAKLVWVFSPSYGKWVQGYQSVSGAGPKTDECTPPAPPGMAFAWVYAPQYNGWIWGFTRADSAGPK